VTRSLSPCLLVDWLPRIRNQSRVRRRPAAPRPSQLRLDLLEERTLLRASTLTSLADNLLGVTPLTKFGPLVQVSSTSLFADTNADNVHGQSGTNYLNSEVEPSMTVDPANPKHLVGAWQQDRWSTGGARDLVTGVTYDGGMTWTLVAVPGATLVAGGTYQRASDAWVSFATDGTVYLSLYAFDDKDYNQAMLVYRSYDGGLTWGPPTAVIADNVSNVTDDKESVTADPTNPQFAYYTWDRLYFDPVTFNFIDGPAYFSRTTDGGQTWESPRVLYGDIPNTQTIGNQIVVTPDGTLLDIFTFFNPSGTKLEVVRSTDHGATWTSPITVATESPAGVFNPTTVRTGTYSPAIAVDHRDGTLYVTWEDGRFSGFGFDSVALSISKDAGLTWSTPIQVNKTPTNLPRARQEAFTPSAAVAANGNVAITYFDFRNPNNQPGGLPTDYWIVFGHGNQDLTNPANWVNEQRLTTASFNMELAPVSLGRGYFVGDYMALTAGGENANSFSALFAQTVSAADPSSIFFRDPSPDDAGSAPRLDAFVASVVTRTSPQRTASEEAIPATAHWPSQVQPLDTARLDQYFAADPAPVQMAVRTYVARGLPGSRPSTLVPELSSAIINRIVPHLTQDSPSGSADE